MTYPPLDCNRPTYRAIAYPEDIDREGFPKWQSLKRRKIDSDGVSLALTTSRCTRDLTAGNYGIFTVHIGHVRSVSDSMDTLDVIQDEPEHSNIVGMPWGFDTSGNGITDVELKARIQHIAVRLLKHIKTHMEKHGIRFDPAVKYT